ncbi:MAG: NAD-dependent DNA ligase LigA [Candidatus Nealsonbacteria bacterium]
MTKDEAKKRIEKLKKLINHHRYFYHVLDKQEIPDSAFDSLKHELYKLEQEYPEFITFDSPTQRVGGKPLAKFKKVEHSSPMLSIEDIFSKKELEDWDNFLKRIEKDVQFEYFAEPKIDGFGVTLIYDKGLFITGATRGNGRIGEDVTQNLKTLNTIPLRLEIKNKLSDEGINSKLEGLLRNGKIEIRGEVFMEKKDFEKFKDTYSNPRNLAAGSIRQLDPKLAASRPLKFLGYDIPSDTVDMGQTKHSEEHQILTALGFKSTVGRVCKNLSDIVDFWEDIAKRRESLPFQIDGVVISVNDNAIFTKLGVAGKSPRGVRAFKFSPKQATTKIRDVKFQIGRTGVVTPVAHLEPVQIEGVTITRATLHNEDEIKKLGVKINDTVIVERAGDVIPAVVKAITELRIGKEKEIKFPEYCPGCKTKLARLKGEVAWRCPNPKCLFVKRKNLYYFISKKSFDIEGLGPKIIDQLVEQALISRATDIFELKEGDLIPLERFAEKSAKNLLEAIQKSKKIPLSRFIYSLGIRHVGEETAIDLANQFGSVDNLMKVSKEDLEKIADIGPKVSETVYNWFQSIENQKFISALKKLGVEIIPPLFKKISGKLKGKTFVLTGSLKTITREQAREKIRLSGGYPTDSVSRRTNYLVLGEDPGLKLDVAKKFGVKIIKEKEFLELIG